MILSVIIRKFVKKHPKLKDKLKKADSKYTPFQYMYNTLFMTIFTYIFLIVFLFIIFKKNLTLFLYASLGSILLIPFIYKFFLSIVDVQIEKLKRELDSDLMFVSEFFLVELSSGLPVGNAIENISKFNRPSGRFFKRVLLDFKTGVSLNKALENAYYYAPSRKFKELLKKMRDSLIIGVDLIPILKDFLDEASEQNLIKIKKFSKSINPIVLMYLLLGIIFPSLGVALFILGSVMLNVTPALLKYILIAIFFLVFLFQYFSFTMFKYKKDVIKI